jgi:hypothetical protein
MQQKAELLERDAERVRDYLIQAGGSAFKNHVKRRLNFGGTRINSVVTLMESRGIVTTGSALCGQGNKTAVTLTLAECQSIAVAVQDTTTTTTTNIETPEVALAAPEPNPIPEILRDVWPDGIPAERIDAAAKEHYSQYIETYKALDALLEGYCTRNESARASNAELATIKSKLPDSIAKLNVLVRKATAIHAVKSGPQGYDGWARHAKMKLEEHAILLATVMQWPEDVILT